MKKFHVIDFLDSNLDEIDYYNINNYSKEELITLKEYLNVINNKEINFKKEISLAEDSIKSKCSWVNNITIHRLKEYLIILNTTDDNEMIVYYDKKNDSFRGYLFKMPKYFGLKEVSEDQKRKEDLNIINEELKEVYNMGKANFHDVFLTESASANYRVDYQPYKSGILYLNNPEIRLATLNAYNKRDSLNEEYKEKALNKILIKQKSN